jgi:hypothetical protein
MTVEQSEHTGRSRFLSAGRRILATVFFLSAGAKLADIAEFIRSVMILGDMIWAFALPTGMLVLLLEVAIGTFLFTGHRPKLAMLCAAGLLTGFSVLLSVAVFREIAGTCGCFGSLGPHLPYRYQALGDIALAVGAIAVADLFPRRGGGLLLGLFGIWAVLLLVAPAPLQESSLGIVGDGKRQMGNPSVLLLADFSDFGCHVCLEDFLALCDSLNVRATSGEAEVRLIARRDSSRAKGVQERFLAGWAKGNGYRFSVVVDSGGVFARAGVAKTSILVENGKGEVIARSSFPLGRGRRREILSLL